MSILIKSNDVSPSVLAARENIARAVEAQTIASKPWYEYPSPAEYRQAQLEGKEGHRKPVFDSEAVDYFLPSRHGDHSILLRKFVPQGKASKGVFLHFHASEPIGTLQVSENIS